MATHRYCSRRRHAALIDDADLAFARADWPAMEAGSSLVERQLAFTTDSKYLLCCSGTAVKLFSIETGALLRVLDGHTADVTAVAHVTSNVFQALSAGLDGRILLWDLDDATLLRAFCVGQPIVAMALHPTVPTTAFVLTSADLPPPEWTPRYAQGVAFGGRAYSVSLRVTKRSAKRARDLAARSGRTGCAQEAGGASDAMLVDADADGDADEEAGGAGAFGSLERPWPVEAHVLFRAKSQALVVGTCGETSPLVAAVSGSWLTVYDVADKATGHFRQRREKRAGLECVALSPSERLAATADECGRIHLWRLDKLATRDEAARKATGAGASSASGPAREMHWHAQALQALAFSVDGSLVLSAGREGVLVFWQTHAAERAFLPRLGAPVLGMTAAEDGATLALRGADNKVQLIDMGARRVARTIHGMRRALKLLPDARLRAVVLYGGEASSSLQWWSPTTDAHVGSLAAAPANLSGSLPAVGSQRDSRVRSYRVTAAAGGTAAPRVTHAALSADGTQLATFEVRANAELRQHSCLKLWALRDAVWVLVTRVPQPHAGALTALAFHPTLLIALTAAHDAKFKLWEAVPPAARGFRNAPAKAEEEESKGGVLALPPPAGSSSGGPPAPLRAGSAVGSWACRSVGYYRQSAALAAAFSTDGSMMAVAYAPDVITLWEPLSNLLLATLTQPLEANDELSFLAFPADGGTLLAHSSRAVFCFSLLTSHLLWAYQAPGILAAAADPGSDAALVAVALATAAAPRAADGRCTAFALLEFGLTPTTGEGPPTVGVPRRAWRLSEAPRSVSFLPSAGGGRGTPLCLGGSGELFLLSDEEQTPPDSKPSAPRMSLRHIAPSRLASIFGAAAAREDPAPDDMLALDGLDDDDDGGLGGVGGGALVPRVAAGARDGGWEARALDAWVARHLSSVPSHLLPPVAAIYPRLMDALMLEAPHLAEGQAEEPAPSELELAELAQAKAEGRGAHFARLVELYTPAVRRGKLSAAERKRKQKALLSPDAEEEEEEEAETPARAKAPAFSSAKGGALQRGFLTGGGDVEMEEEEEEAGAGAVGVVGEATQAGAWPPAGWELLELGGVPNPGHLVRTLAPAPPSASSGLPAGLSAADAAFWRQHAFDEASLSALGEWAEQQPGATAAAADAFALAAPLVWDAEDEAPGEVWARVLASGALGVSLAGAPGGADLAREVAEARAALEAAGIEADAERGYGIATGAMPAEMRQPPTAGWQHAPTKLELKALAKEYREGAQEDVLAAGLRASNLRAARRAAEGADA